MIHIKSLIYVIIMRGTWRRYIICTIYLLYLHQFIGDVFEWKKLNSMKFTIMRKKVPPMTQTQSQTGYGSSMTMMPTFVAGYCDSEIDTGYYDAGVGP
uniref:Uncharacterized protein n=1 Tax=Cucumis melo TaxID=3656 RepID=A0A9I9DN57_CUCME